jgi:hypothetical protein
MPAAAAGKPATPRGNTGGWRTSLDLSRPLLRGKLATRVSAVYQHDEFNQKPSSYNTRRLNFG